MCRVLFSPPSCPLGDREKYLTGDFTGRAWSAPAPLICLRDISAQRRAPASLGSRSARMARLGGLETSMETHNKKERPRHIQTAMAPPRAGANALVAVACALGLLLGAGNSEARLSVDDPHNRELHGTPLANWPRAKAFCSSTCVTVASPTACVQVRACGTWRKRWRRMQGLESVPSPMMMLRCSSSDIRYFGCGNASHWS